jgi:hypothetical protein
MARPRKPDDPERWPVPCDRCGGHYMVVANWPGESVCGYCYQAAKRVTGICACGHQGVLPGIIDARPACRRCTGITLNVDCVACGDEAELYSGGKCQRCVLGETATRFLTNPDTGVVASQLQVIIDARRGAWRLPARVSRRCRAPERWRRVCGSGYPHFSAMWSGSRGIRRDRRRSRLRSRRRCRGTARLRRGGILRSNFSLPSG